MIIVILHTPSRLPLWYVQINGALHCLSVVAGVASVIFQGLSHEDILSWATHLYQV